MTCSFCQQNLWKPAENWRKNWKIWSKKRWEKVAERFPIEYQYIVGVTFVYFGYWDIGDIGDDTEICFIWGFCEILYFDTIYMSFLHKIR